MTHKLQRTQKTKVGALSPDKFEKTNLLVGPNLNINFDLFGIKFTSMDFFIFSINLSRTHSLHNAAKYKRFI